ncbi:gene transfer agent family protein [uncultured Tateyamaria sp.]|uniref:gene transfer agent family protein n=1 Tax=uncultured Tateyamaria sp. TaxID=455651 RepID=UPI00262894DA|nr:gene transfer agent family protein [uncultured Tateyamaria sp.]
MTNPWRGEVTLVIDGQPQVMRLTLGALAGLETALAEPSLVALVERFEQGRFSSTDVLAVLKAGLAGGSCAFDADHLDHADIAGGPMGAARAAAELIARAFVVPEA